MSDIDFEEKLWQAADKLRSNMDAAEYKHVVLGLIFLKYISDSFEELYNKLKQDPEGLPEDKDEYISNRVFFVPKDARWQYIQDNAKDPIIGKIIDDAMDSIEKENPSLKGILLKEYAKPSLDKAKLGGLIDLIGSITFGSKESKSKDVLGRVYEYFLGQFASAEGKKGGQFYTPKCIVKLLVEMIKPYKGRVFDPCCGSGGMFVQSENFVNEHGGKIGQISIYGQESNQTTWKLCKMNLAIRGIDNKVVWNTEGSFLNDEHKDLRSDFILANPPFNDSDWSGELLREDARWKYGVPPAGNANFAWVSHFIYHLSPNGIAGFVLSNGSLSSNTSNEGEIRKNIIKEDLVDCVVALPSQLFYNTMIPACLWFVNKKKPQGRRGETLFIDARNLGQLINRRQRVLTDIDIKKISDTYDSWKSEDSNYKDQLAFCKSAKLEEIEKQDFILTPGRYVGFKEEEDDPEAFKEKMKRLTRELKEQMEESRKLDQEIKNNLEKIGFKI
ncbi:MAG: class I SAM-dependent DNA methyltransferase [archaeon]